jgi:hypothetical protein
MRVPPRLALRVDAARIGTLARTYNQLHHCTPAVHHSPTCRKLCRALPLNLRLLVSDQLCQFWPLVILCPLLPPNLLCSSQADIATGPRGSSPDRVRAQVLQPQASLATLPSFLDLCCSCSLLLSSSGSTLLITEWQVQRQSEKVMCGSC